MLAVWVVAAGGALLVANALDSPVGEGARDEAQAVAPGPSAVPGTGSQAGGATGLQPLALFLDDPLAEDIAGLPPIRRPARLAELRPERPGPAPPRRARLGAAARSATPRGRGPCTGRRCVATRTSVAAQAGLAMVEGAGGGAAAWPGPRRAWRGSPAENPQDQLVAFNQGIVEVYRQRPARVAAAWIRALQIDRDTYLGRAAVEGLNQLRQQAAGGTP